MSNLHLVTGHAGRTHVTAADHGSFYAALFGSGTYLLDKGSKFAASVIADNLVRIADGDLLMQGRHIRIADNEYEDLTIPSGTQGYKRRDLIVARYTKDEVSGIEEADLVVLIGEPIAAEPADPAYITGDILAGGALINDVPLYRVNLDGVTITGVDSLLPHTIPHQSDIEEMVKAFGERLDTFSGVKSATGTYNGVGTQSFSITFPFMPLVAFINQTSKGSSNSSSAGTIVLFGGYNHTQYSIHGSTSAINMVSWSGNTVTMKTDQTSYNYINNYNGNSYRWIALA